MSDRPKGKVVYSSLDNPEVKKAVADAHKEVVAEKDRLQTERIERREHRYNTMPNRVCYADTAFKDWRPGDPIPECLKCRGKLYPEEHHNCPGYIPKYRTDGLSHDERMEIRKAGWDDWNDDQYDPTTPDETTRNVRMRREAETGESYDQVVIDGMTEEEDLKRRFGYVPNFEDFEE